MLLNEILTLVDIGVFTAVAFDRLFQSIHEIRLCLITNLELINKFTATSISTNSI